MAALGAVVLAVVVVAIIVLGSGTTYKVKADFSNASQLVSGNLVEVAGSPIGTVSDISLTPNGLARITLQINDKNYQPLREGTQAIIRQASLSGVANRYIDIRPGPAGGAKIADGGSIPTQNTTSQVDLDQLFNTLDAPTRKGLQEVFKGSASQYEGQGAAAQRGWQYLNPAVVSSSVLFRELNRDTGKFTTFLVKSGNLLGDIAQRQSDLTGLVQNASVTFGALAAQRVALGQSIQRLPGFMRLGNTTFVNLRRALDDVQPLVDASKPVAPKLNQLLVQLRPLAVDSVPTVRDLSAIVCSAPHEAIGCNKAGPPNDLIDLTRLGVPLANATVHDIKANGKVRPGAFPISTQALNMATPELAVARPYAVDLTGWFEGYTHPGTIDANGGSSRIAPVIGLASAGLPTNQQLQKLFGSLLGPGFGGGLLVSGQGDRCPGSMERGGIWFPESGYPCTPSQVPTGQ